MARKMAPLLKLWTRNDVPAASCGDDHHLSGNPVCLGLRRGLMSVVVALQLPQFPGLPRADAHCPGMEAAVAKLTGAVARQHVARRGIVLQFVGLPMAGGVSMGTPGAAAAVVVAACATGAIPGARDHPIRIRVVHGGAHAGGEHAAGAAAGLVAVVGVGAAAAPCVDRAEVHNAGQAAGPVPGMPVSATPAGCRRGRPQPPKGLNAKGLSAKLNVLAGRRAAPAGKRPRSEQGSSLRSSALQQPPLQCRQQHQP